MHIQLSGYQRSLGLQGSRAQGVRPKKCRGPGLQDGKFGGSQDGKFTPGLHLAKNNIFVRASKSREALGSWLHDKTFRAPGLQRPPLWVPELSLQNL